jgi:uncharacterized protein YoxC
MEPVNIVSYISLALAVIFWILSGSQARDARKVLDEIKTAMLSWQADLNKTSFDIMSSRPELIAKQTSLEESKSKSESLKELMAIISDLSTSPYSSDEENKFRLEALEKLSKHHYGLIISKEKLIHDAAMSSMQPPQRPEDQNEKS